MKNISYNSKSTQIDDQFSKMVQRELEANPEVHPIAKGMDQMLDILRSCKPPKVTFTVESSEIDWKNEEIKVIYFQNGLEEDDPEYADESAVDRITIQEFCTWMKKEKHNTFIPEGHNYQGIFTQGNPKTYEPEDLLRDAIFDRDYFLELFLSDRGY